MDNEKLVIEIMTMADGVAETIRNVQKAVESLEAALGSYASRIQATSSSEKKATDDAKLLESAIKGIQDAGDGMEGTLNALKEGEKDADSLVKSIVNATKGMGAIGQAINGVISVIQVYDQRLRQVQDEHAQKKFKNALHKIDLRMRRNELDSEEEIARLIAVQAKYAVTEEQKLEIEERIHAARKQMEEDTFDDELSRIDRLRGDGEITAQEQVKRLEEIACTRKLTAKQKEKLTEKLYLAEQKAFTEEDVRKVMQEERSEIREDEQENGEQDWEEWFDAVCRTIFMA